MGVNLDVLKRLKDNRGLKGREPRVAYGLILRTSQLESERG